MEIEDEKEISTLEDYKLVHLVSERHVLILTKLHPVESLLELIESSIESLE